MVGETTQGNRVPRRAKRRRVKATTVASPSEARSVLRTCVATQNRNKKRGTPPKQDAPKGRGGASSPPLMFVHSFLRIYGLQYCVYPTQARFLMPLLCRYSIDVALVLHCDALAPMVFAMDLASLAVSVIVGA